VRSSLTPCPGGGVGGVSGFVVGQWGRMFNYWCAKQGMHMDVKTGMQQAGRP
jgi:hypothetical protein